MAEDLKPFYVRSLEDRQRAVETSAGDAALAQFEPMTSPQAKPTDGSVQINADPSAPQDLSKVPGYKPTWMPPAKRLQTPSPDEARRMMGRPTRTYVPGEDLPAEDQPQTLQEQIDATMRSLNTEQGMDPETGLHPKLKTLIEYVANTKDVADLQKRLNSPEGVSLIEGLGLSTPFMNAVMHAAHEVLTAGGVPEPYSSVGEYVSALLVPSRMAIQAGGAVALDRVGTGEPGAAGKVVKQIGATALDKVRQIRDGGLSKTLAGELATNQGFSWSVAGRRAVKFPEATRGVSIAPELEQAIKGVASPEQISAYLKKNEKVLKDPRAAFGGWYDKGSNTTYLDISVAAKSHEANAVGASTGQRAIFDPVTKDSIPVDYGAKGPHPYHASSEPLKPQDIEIARAYDAAASNPDLKPHWDSLASETDRLFEEISKTGPRMELVDGQPYTSAEQMAKEVRETGVMKVSKDNSEHPFWTPEQNARFRYVHDMLGHVEPGHDFSLEGEYRAWLAHETKLADETAKTALKTEVYGQAASAVANSGRFAEQKAVDLGKGLAPIEERLSKGLDLVNPPSMEQRFADAQAAFAQGAQRSEAGLQQMEGLLQDSKGWVDGVKTVVSEAGAEFVSAVEKDGQRIVSYRDPVTGKTGEISVDKLSKHNLQAELGNARAVEANGGLLPDQVRAKLAELEAGGLKNTDEYRALLDELGPEGTAFKREASLSPEAAQAKHNAAVEAGGAQPIGITADPDGNPMVWFNDPITGSTHLLFGNEVSPERVKQVLEESRKAWGKGALGMAAGAAVGDDDDPYSGTVLGAALGIGVGNLKLLRDPALAEKLAGKLRVGGRLENALVARGVGKLLMHGADDLKFAQEMYKEFGSAIIPHLDSLLARSKKALAEKIDTLDFLTPYEEVSKYWNAVSDTAPDWYGTPALLRQIVGPDTELMASLLAATSPQQAVRPNVDAALAVYKILKTEPTFLWKKLIGPENEKLMAKFGISGENILPNVWRAIRREELNGNKVVDFKHAILGDESVFTVDRHIARFAGVQQRASGLNDAEYSTLSEWGKQFASNMGTPPRYAQQRLWIGGRLVEGIEDEFKGSNNPLFDTVAEMAKEQGVLDLVPKSSLLGEEGRTRAGVAWVLGRAALGAVIGGEMGDTNEERLRNALMGVGVVGLAPTAIAKLSRLVKDNAHVVRNLVRKPTNQYPPEVAQALDRLFTGYDAEIAAATRGVRPHAQALNEAEQMIRSGQMGMDEVRAWFPGQTMNDAEAMAFIKTMATHATLVQDYVSGLAQQASKGALPPEAVDGLLQRLFTLREFLPRPAGIRAESGRTLSAMNEPTAGWNAYLDQWHQIFTDPKLGMTPESLIATISKFKRPDQFARLAVAQQAPGWTDMIIEGLYGALLGNPVTLSVNAAADALTASYAVIERTAGAVMGDSLHWAEPFALLYGYTKSIPLAWKNAVNTFQTGQSAFGGASKVEAAAGPMSGVTHDWLKQTMLGKIAETLVPVSLGSAAYAAGMDPMQAATVAWATHPATWALGPRALKSTDEIFKTMLFEGEKWAQALRRGAAITDPKLRKQKIAEIVQSPNSVVRGAAENFANEFTFNGRPGPIMQGLMDGINDPNLPGPYKVFAKTQVPFLNVPNNIFKFIGRRTPGLQQLSASWWNDLKTPGPRQDTALGQLALGASWLSVIAAEAAQGNIVGSGPGDPNLFREWIADGNQEYSARFGNKTFSINRLDPFGGMIGLVSDWAAISAHIDDATNDQIATALLMAVSKDMMSKTYLQGASNVLDAITTKDPNKAYRWLQQSSGTLTPSLVKQQRQIADPYFREVRGLIDAQMDRLPEFSKKLAVRKNIFADPITNHEPIGYGVDLVNPFVMRTKKNDPASKALLDNKISVAMPGWAIFGGDDKKFTLDPQRESVGVPLSAEQRDELVDLIGKPLKREWLAFVNSSDYDAKNVGPDSMNALVFRRLYTKFREAGVKTLVDKYPLLERDLEVVLARRKQSLESPLAPRQLENAR